MVVIQLCHMTKFGCHLIRVLYVLLLLILVSTYVISFTPLYRIGVVGILNLLLHYIFEVLIYLVLCGLLHQIIIIFVNFVNIYVFWISSLSITDLWTMPPKCFLDLNNFIDFESKTLINLQKNCLIAILKLILNSLVSINLNYKAWLPNNDK
jgi:hypothetical protein